MKPGSYLLVGVTGLPDRFPKLQKARSFYTTRSIQTGRQIGLAFGLVWLGGILREWKRVKLE